MNGMNPMQLMQMIKNPQQFLMQAFAQKSPNPMISNLMKQAQNGDAKAVESFARNFCKERGMDFDKEFSNFMRKKGS